jgi:serpin B
MLTLVTSGVLLLAAPAAAPGPEARSVVAANNQFALDLYGRLCGPEGNLFLSPYSITKALAMAYTGARGQTAAEMSATLHFHQDPDHLHLAFAQTRRMLNNQGGLLPGIGRKGVQLHLAAALWGQAGYGLRKGFRTQLQEGYGAGVYEIDFANAERARQTINAWTQRQTHDKVKELFSPGLLNLNTRLVLTTAICFKGDWAHAFSKDQTRGEPFRLGGDRRKRVPLMHQTDTFGYFESNEMQGLQLPYQDGRLAMVVLLPRKPDGLTDLESSLTAQRLDDWMGRLNEQKVDVSLPRFRLTAAFSLADVLAKMGMRRAFHEDADFSGINDGREPLYISAVMHRAFVEVQEEGTEAAAASEVEFNTIALPPQTPRPVFRADHPFLFAIRDVPTGTLLFLGRVVQP